MGGWTAATEVQQEMFSHFALISVELANSFWPRKLSAAPIGVFFKCKTLFKALVEHFIPRLQVVDKEETVGFPRCLLIQPVQLLLWQQASITASSSCWLRSLQQQRNCMLTRTAALMSLSFCELTQVLICVCRRRLVYAIAAFSVILRCCWMMRRSAGSSQSFQ